MIGFGNISQSLLTGLLAVPAQLAQSVTPTGPPGAQPPTAPPQPVSDTTSSWVLWIGLLALTILIAVIVLQLGVRRRRRKRAQTAATFGPPGMYASHDPGFTNSPPEPTLPHTSFPTLRGALSALWLRRR